MKNWVWRPWMTMRWPTRRGAALPAFSGLLAPPLPGWASSSASMKTLESLAESMTSLK